MLVRPALCGPEPWGRERGSHTHFQRSSPVKESDLPMVTQTDGSTVMVEGAHSQGSPCGKGMS